MQITKVTTVTMGKFHPLVMTLIIYALADVAFSCALGLSAFHMGSMWSNPYYPLLHSGVVLFSVLSVYFIAYSNIKLALALHGLLKLIVFLFTMHSMVFPEFYQIQKQESVAPILYYLSTLLFEMTAFFVINKMNIPFFVDDEIYDPDIIDDEDEVMVTCC